MTIGAIDPYFQLGRCLLHIVTSYIETYFVIIPKCCSESLEQHIVLFDLTLSVIYLVIIIDHDIVAHIM